MKKSFLIADSGGTKTDWCYIDPSDNKSFFSTSSYHPNLMNEDWMDANRAFWKKYSLIENLEVHFYGSGCFKEANQLIVKNVFHNWGFDQVFIESDILAAGRACFGDEDGWIGILGTGSVLAEIENKKIKQIYGGLGSLAGDEGSGFYFGKLLIAKYLKNEFSLNTTIEIESLIDKKNLFDIKIEESSAKNFIANLSRVLSGTISQEIKQLHIENIELFFDKYLPYNIENQSICFVGSYAHNTREIIEEYLEKRHLTLGKIIIKPIVLLSEYTVKSTF